MAVKEKDKWGALECLDVYRDVVVKEERGGRETYRDWFLSLRCQCGKVWSMLRRDFVGKRKMLDCGCGFGAGVGGLKTVVTVYVEVGTVERLKGYAAEQGVSVSKAAGDLWRAMLG